ncbi:hypothetical protein HDU97_007682 [Phlyctochytrium planicorne]|nr:hypothetical protein HDU97_007682 [Phlyctochytrium planicorne]
MFGFNQNSTFGSNPGNTVFGNTNQQPQTGFGAPNPGFGAQPNTGFGQASSGLPTFGSTAPAFGTNAGFSGGASTFGARPQSTFGAANNNVFGGSTGLGGGSTFSFGGAPSTSNFSSGGSALFGGNTGGGFGANAGTTSAFGGSGATTFGGGQAGSGQFGAATSFGAPGQTTPNMNCGTGNPTWQLTQDRDGVGPSTTGTFLHSISAMPNYKTWSPEELRLQDYTMNKKFSAQTGPGFGTNTFATPGPGGSTFSFGGGTNNTQPTSTFGATPTSNFTFGAAQPQQQGGIFGGGQSTSNSFLNPSATTGGFGSNTTGSTFGGFGGQPAASTSTFGSGGGFGASTPKTGFGFGTPSTGTGFGAGGTTSTFGANAGSSNLFGNKTPTSTTFGSGFGSANTGFGATGAFGSNNAANTGTGGLFNRSPQNNTGGFGFNTQNNAASTPFGANSSFGGAQQNTFGQNNTGSLFQSSTSTPAFGANNTAIGAKTAGNFFGSTPAPTSTFGGNLGGFNQTTNQSGSLMNPLSGGLGTSTFGGLGTSSAMGNNLFGGSGAANSFMGANNNGAGQTLQASIDRNPYGSNPLFPSETQIPKANMNISGPQLFSAEIAAAKKPALLPHFKVTPKSATKMKLRGFASSPNLREQPTPITSSKQESPNRNSLPRGVLNLLKEDADSPLSLSFPESFRPRAKKLILSDDADVPSSGASSKPEATPQPGGLKSVRFDDAEDDGIQEEVVDVVSGPHASGSRNGELKHTSPASNKRTSKKSSSGYVMEPSFEELMEMSDIELTRVQGFTVSLENVGKVKFLEPVNLLQASPTGTREGIAEIPGSVVILRHKAVDVYPDDNEKDPVGTGVNVPAEVQLERCWAIDKKTGKIIDDETDPQFDKHFRKLESIPDTKFIGFNYLTGCWRFRVEHFSRYGLEDDDSDEEGGESPRRVEYMEELSVEIEEEDVIEDVEEEEGEGEEEAEDLSFSDEVPDDSFARIRFRPNIRSPVGDLRLAAKPQRMIFEDSSKSLASQQQLTAESSEHRQSCTPPFHTASLPSSAGKNLSELRRRKNLQASLFESKADSPAAPPLKRPFENIRRRNEPSAFHTVDNADVVATDMPGILRPLAETSVWATNFDFEEKSVATGFDTNVADAGLAMGRSFRVGWGPNGSFTAAGRFSGSENLSVLSLCKLTVFKFQKEKGESSRNSALVKEKERHRKCLTTLFDHCNFAHGHGDAMAANEEELLMCSANSSLTFRHFIAASSYPELFDQREQLIWKLCTALFDKLDDPDGILPLSNVHHQALADGLRKEDISAWLQTAVGDQNSKSSSIFTLLCSRKIGEACSLALKTRNFRLATLMAQANACGRVRTVSYVTSKSSVSTSGHGLPGRGGVASLAREDILRQVLIWNDTQSFSGPQDILNVWKLLSGHIDLWRSDVLSKDQTWLQQLALIVWFGNGGYGSLAESLHLFDSLWESKEIRPPWPAHLQKPNLVKPDVYDIFYHLLKMSSDPGYLLEKSIRPESISSMKLDVRVPWILSIVLSQSKKVRRFSDSHTISKGSGHHITSKIGDSCTMSFCSGLLSLGLWEWACFVALFLSDKNSSEMFILEILSRNYPLSDTSGSILQEISSSIGASEFQESGYASETFSFLTKKLGIPANWIFQAKALRARYEGRDWEEAISLIDSKQFSAAHREYRKLEVLLSKLPFEEIAAWSKGGALVLEFIRCSVSTERILKNLESYQSHLVGEAGRSAFMEAASEEFVLELENTWLPKLHRISEDLTRALTNSSSFNDSKLSMLFGMPSLCRQRIKCTFRIAIVEMHGRIGALAEIAKKLVDKKV